MRCDHPWSTSLAHRGLVGFVLCGVRAFLPEPRDWACVSDPPARWLSLLYPLQELDSPNRAVVFDPSGAFA
jgi:hypothetical protein